MAGAEKVCEVCDEWVGGEMYNMSRDLFQVCPSCRPKFRGKKATVILGNYEKIFIFSFGAHTNLDKGTEELIAERSWRGKRGKNYETIIAFDDGKFYYHHATDLRRLKRRVKRLTRQKDLSILHNMDLEVVSRQMTSTKENINDDFRYIGRL